jgi:hypothetical protein
MASGEGKRVQMAKGKIQMVLHLPFVICHWKFLLSTGGAYTLRVAHPATNHRDVCATRDEE